MEIFGERSNDDHHQIEIANANQLGRTVTNEVDAEPATVDSILLANNLTGVSEQSRVNHDVGVTAAVTSHGVQECTNQPGNISVESSQNLQFQSQNVILEEALQCIRNDSSVGMIGIWGPAGVGKTYILKKINNSFVEDSTFDFVIFITASGDCSVQMLQSKITKRLNLKEDDDAMTQSAIIRNFLNEKSFLLLLDDLWGKHDLVEVGIPYPLGSKDQLKHKVVITIGDQIVCDLMDVEKYIKMPGLEENEALQLFEENVGKDNLYNDPHIGALAKDLVKELEGLPSELIHIGMEMRSKEDPSQWQDVICMVKKLNIHKDDNRLGLSIKTGRIVRDLEDATNGMLAKRKGVLHKIEIAERSGRTRTEEVKLWLDRVDKIEPGARAIIGQYKLNKNVGGSAQQKLQQIQQCLNEEPSNIYLESLNPPVIDVRIQPIVLPSQEIIVEEARRCIMDDKMKMIGIWGPGGVGKTYILQKINKSFAESSLPGISFNFVIFITASRGCSLSDIQEQIADRLNIKQDSNEKLVIKISKFLEGKSFLVLVDDLWEKLKLSEVGIPYPLINHGGKLTQKVVLTTRSEKVCAEMAVNKKIKVTALSDDDAFHLFEENADKEVINNSALIKKLAKDLVKELRGLPLVLITTGRTMSSRRGPKEWEDAILHMQESWHDTDDPLSMENIYRQLKYSYDSLSNDKLRECFLTFSLWPEDQDIIRAELAQCWMGLRIVNEPDIPSSYNKAHWLIGDLVAACLLENGDMGDDVKIHDVLRDMALWISNDCGKNNGKWVVRTGRVNSRAFINDAVNIGKQNGLKIDPYMFQKRPENWTLSRNFPWSNAGYVSLMCNNMRKLPPVVTNHSPLKLKVLCLQRNNLDKEIAGIIREFTALTYLDLSWNELTGIPEEICLLRNLEYLNLSYNMSLCEVPEHLGLLINLKFLYLEGTNIQTIPEGTISPLKQLQVLDLWNHYFAGGIAMSPGQYIPTVCPELGTLNNLKEVSIVVHGTSQYESLSKCRKLPLRRVALRNLDSQYATFILQEGIYADNLVGTTLSRLEIARCDMKTIMIRKDAEAPQYCFEALETLELISLKKLTEIKWYQMYPQEIFPRLSYLKVSFCEQLKDLSCVTYLRELEYLEVTYCRSIKRAFGFDTNTSNTFPSLRFLYLAHLEALEKICNSDVTFPQLETLSLTGCRNLVSLPFKKETVCVLKKLRELELEHIECWNKLIWEEEGVQSLLEPYLKIEERPTAEELTKVIQCVLPFYPSDSRYCSGRCPCDSEQMNIPYPQVPPVATLSIQDPLIFNVGAEDTTSTRPSTSKRHHSRCSHH